jgi:ABC-type polysaccharide/polyol phosphate transport system ATPase subunit
MPPVIRFDNVSKRYRLGSRLGDLREFVPDPFAAARRWWRRRNGNGDEHDEPEQAREVWALNDVSFEVEEGEALGIIGPNGAGKSTILKLLAGITEPTRGSIETRGRVSALIEVGAGFHPDLTGRENVYLNGSILGLSKREIDAKFGSIVGFAEVERFIDTPVKRYSSGMYVRLGFAVAAHLDPQVLLVDEVLAVGDSAFQRRCLDHMRELASSSRTVVLVSHNLALVSDLCPRTVVLSRGAVLFDGATQRAMGAYSESVQASFRVGRPATEGLGRAVVTRDAEILGVTIVDETGRPVTHVRSGTRGEIRMRVRFNAPLREPQFGSILRRADGLLVTNVGSTSLGVPTGDYAAGEEVEVAFCNRWSLGSGTYYFTVHVTDQSRRVRCDWREAAATLLVTSPNVLESVADLGTEVRVRRLDAGPEVLAEAPEGQTGACADV